MHDNAYTIKIITAKNAYSIKMITIQRRLQHKKKRPIMVAPDKKTLKKSVKSMFFMVQTRCEVETIKY